MQLCRLGCTGTCNLVPAVFRDLYMGSHCDKRTLISFLQHLLLLSTVRCQCVAYAQWHCGSAISDAVVLLVGTASAVKGSLRSLMLARSPLAGKVTGGLPTSSRCAHRVASFRHRHVRYKWGSGVGLQRGLQRRILQLYRCRCGFGSGGYDWLCGLWRCRM